MSQDLVKGSSIQRAPASAPARRACWTRPVTYAVVAVAALALWAVRWRGPIDLRYDAAVYYVLGTSLAEGHGYRILSEPGAPEGVQYPPLLPAIVALHQKALGTSDPTVVGPWLRGTFAALFVVYAIAALALARRLLPPGLAVLAVLLTLGQANTYLYSDLLFTELPFALASVGFVGVLAVAPATRGREAAAFGLASAAFLLRSAGIALLATWVAEALWRRDWRHAGLRALLAAVPFLAWQTHIAAVRKSEDYRHPAYAYQRANYQFYNVTYAENMSLADPFRPELGPATPAVWAKRVLENLAAMPAAVGECVSESIGFWRATFLGTGEENVRQHVWENRWARMPLYILFGFVAVGGAVLFARRERPMLLLIVSSMALVCTTPWPEQFARYLTPLIPFLAIAAVLGGQRAWEWLGTQPRRTALARWAVVGFCGVVVLVQLAAAYFVFRQRHYEPATFVPGRGFTAPRLFYYGPAWVDWEKAVRWVGREALPGDVVATTSPHLCYLWTGLPAVMPPMAHDPAEARRLLDTVPVRWVIVDELKFLDISERYARPAVEGETKDWRLVKTIRGARVYRRVEPGQEEAS